MENLRAISSRVPPVAKMTDVYKMDKLPEFIKIKVHAERIWCKPTNVKYKLEVANNMVDGFKSAGDIIKVSPNRKVYDIMEYNYSI